MNLSWFDVAGFVGVVLIVIAYVLLQLNKLPSTAPAFSLLNALGSFLVMFALVFEFNLSQSLIELFWFLV